MALYKSSCLLFSQIPTLLQLPKTVSLPLTIHTHTHKRLRMDSFRSPVIVKRKEVVAALLPMQNHWLPMSNLDLLLPPLDVGIFFCYKKQKHAGSGIIFPQEENMVNVIKKALAHVLVSFYPFAGELVENSLGEPELLCNNRGVDFVIAYADFSLKELDLYHPDESIHEMLVPSKSHGALSIQVSRSS